MDTKHVLAEQISCVDIFKNIKPQYLIKLGISHTVACQTEHDKGMKI